MRAQAIMEDVFRRRLTSGSLAPLAPSINSTPKPSLPGQGRGEVLTSPGIKTQETAYSRFTREHVSFSFFEQENLSTL